MSGCGSETPSEVGTTTEVGVSILARCLCLWTDFTTATASQLCKVQL